LSRIKVLAVTNAYPTARDPQFGVFVASQMESVGLEADVTIQFLDCTRARWKYAAGIWRVRQAVRHGDYDVVHAHYGLTGFVASFQPLPLVVSFCGDDLLGTPDGRGGLTAKSRLARRLSHYAAGRADGIVCKSQGLRDALPVESDRQRALVIPNGVDTRVFNPGDPAAARRRLGLEPDEKVVLFAFSRGQRVKRLDIAQAAIERLAGRGVRARLSVIREIAPQAMPDHYRAADCLLLTSDSEGSPNVVKEALCCDLPVVSVDVGDVRRWLALASRSRLSSRHPDELASALADVLAGGRDDGSRVRAEVGLAGIAQRILEVYRVAIARRGAGRERRPAVEVA